MSLPRPTLLRATAAAGCCCAVLLLACADSGGKSSLSVSPSRDSSGVAATPGDASHGGTADTDDSVLVTELSPAESGDQAEPWTVRVRARIGQVDGRGPAVFGRISGLAVGDGVVHVFDGFARELRTFSLDGRVIAVHGRRGGGPNEFEAVVGVSVESDGSLWLVDAGNGRYARLESDGSLRTVPRPIATYELPWLGGWDASRRFYDQASIIRGDRVVPVLVRMSRPGAPVDTLQLPAVELKQPSLGSMSFPLPFAPSHVRVLDPAGRVWTALSTRYDVAAIDFGGDTVARIRRNHPQRPLGAAQRDSVATYVRNLTARFGLQVSSDMIPEHAPVIAWMSVDNRGYVWICATGLAPCATLDVFEPSGAFLGTVALPHPASGPVSVRGTVMAYPAQGEFETPMVIIAEITGRSDR